MREKINQSAVLTASEAVFTALELLLLRGGLIQGSITSRCLRLQGGKREGGEGEWGAVDRFGGVGVMKWMPCVFFASCFI